MRFLVNFFRKLWRGLDIFRRVLHLVLLLIIFLVVIGAFRQSIPRLPEQGALVIRPQGEIVEQLAGEPLQRAISEVQGQQQPQTLLWDLTDGIRHANDRGLQRSVSPTCAGPASRAKSAAAGPSQSKWTRLFAKIPCIIRSSMSDVALVLEAVHRSQQRTSMKKFRTLPRRRMALTWLAALGVLPCLPRTAPPSMGR